MSPHSPPSLRDHLVSSLSTIANPFDLDLTVVSSSPKRTNAIFPHARNPPKCHEKQYVITVGGTLPPTPQDTPQETISSSTSSENPGSSSQTRGPSKRKVLVTALHAYIYTTARRYILYISKLDTSGYIPTPTPVTKTLVSSFISYHLRPDVALDARVQVQLFARSQGQYLFPNSAQAPGKRVAGGLKLCAWWKGVYEAVAVDHARLHRPSNKKEHDRLQTAANGDQEHKLDQKIHLRYLLPSYSGDEAAGMLGAPKVPLPAGLQWTYGPPFTTPFDPKTEEQDGRPSLGLLIPSLPDDPKSRFLDELVAEAGPSCRQKAPVPKLSAGASSDAANGTTGRAAVEGGAETDTEDPNPGLKVDEPRALGPKSSGATLVESPKRKPKAASIHSHKEKEKERDEADRKAAESALSKISHGEFWERMGFRQECISGDVTGFFTLELDPPILEPASEPGSSSTTSGFTPTGLGKTASTVTVVGAPDKEPSTSLGLSANGSGKTVSSGSITGSTDVPCALVDRILTSLLNCDFATLPLALESSQIWSNGARGIIVGENGEKGWGECTALIPATQTSNGAEVREKRKKEVVTMLQPRKKKKV